VSEQPLDPSKYHVISKKHKKLLTYLAVFFCVVVLPVLIANYYRLAINRPSQTDKEVTVEIKSGEGVTDIAKQLYDAKAINSETLFAFYMVVHGLDQKIEAGTYVIKAGSTIKDLSVLLQHGLNDTKVTFLEGWRTEEFARLAAQTLPNIDAQKFIAAAKGHEGYLFPDTYLVTKNVQETDLVSELENTFDDKTKTILTDQNLTRVGLTKDQTVILASIVEREAGNDTDRPIIAGIFMNRLKAGDKLDADATTQYAVALTHLCALDALSNGTAVSANGTCIPTNQELMSMNWWPKNLSEADIAFDSPYNTRLNKGLPPSPICNPSLASITAVLNYTHTDYYYYLTDRKGVTHYAKTLQEHEDNIATYL
jgi:UPF0755 protein